MKKLICAILICCMVLPMFPVSATEEVTAQPTIEEILNSYHEKAFVAQVAEEHGGVSTWSRSSNDQTLEQETVGELTDAGYEAYNVTSENYEELEETLGTDFDEMGLNPKSSYIVVISGDEQANPNARVIDPPTNEDFDDDNGGGSSSFTYTEDGITYTMRYVTITSEDAYSELFVQAACMLTDINYYNEVGSILVEYTVDIACEKIIEKVLEESVELIPYVGTICTLVSMAADVQEAVSANPFTVINHDTLVFFSATAWTRRYIQVYDSLSGYWKTAQCSSYAVSKARFEAGYYYDPVTNAPKEMEGIIKDTTTYSPYFNSTAQQNARAVLGYKSDCILYDCTGDIDFYLANPDATNPLWREILLFTHQESLVDLIPEREEG